MPFISILISHSEIEKTDFTNLRLESMKGKGATSDIAHSPTLTRFDSVTEASGIR